MFTGTEGKGAAHKSKGIKEGRRREGGGGGGNLLLHEIVTPPAFEVALGLYGRVKESIYECAILGHRYHQDYSN